MSATVNDIQRSNVIFPQARNDAQQALIDSIQQYGQTITTGPAGTGKTFIPVSIAAHTLMRGQIDAIYMTRPTVEVGGEKLGFLPGELEDKMAPWVWPIMDILQECFGSKGKLDKVVKEGKIVEQPFCFMRGRTFRNCFVLLDEAQNTTPSQMETFLTRLGENCTVVINGDVRQQDVKGTSGLGEILGMVRDQRLPVGLVEFDNEHVERSEACRMWVEAYDELRADVMA